MSSRELLEDYFKNEKIPDWMKAKPLALLERLEEFEATGQNKICEQLQGSLHQWMKSHKSVTVQQDVEVVSPFSKTHTTKLFQERIAEIDNRLKSSSNMIPSEDMFSFQRDIAKLEEVEDWDRLRDLRLRLVDRIRLSINALQHAGKANSYFQADSSSSIGPYNNLHNFLEAVDVVSVNDPIWAGDFFKLYSELFTLQNLFEE